MATCNNENRKTNCTNGLKAPIRNQYFYGKLLTVRDFENEQSYFIKKQRLLNKHIHGEGVVCGLIVERVESDETKIKIKSGIALDCCGREIVVPEDHIVELAGKDDGVYWVTISYSECGKEPVAAATEGNSCEEECCFSRIEEGYEIEVWDTRPEVCPSFDMKNICKTWSSVSKADREGKHSLELVNNLPEFELENTLHILESGLTHNITPDIEKIEPPVKMINTKEEFVKAYQGNCSLTTEQHNRILLAKITLSKNKSISIDNALINGNSFDKKLVHTNPKLYELLKCAGKEEEEAQITITGISWPHAEPYDFGNIIENGLIITFSEEIECFATNQCSNNEFSVFPEVFKMEILARDEQSPMQHEFIVPGELINIKDKNALKFNLNNEAIEYMKEYMNKFIGGQVRITLNGNFLRGADKNSKSIYCGRYQFKVDQDKDKDNNYLTTLDKFGDSTSSCGKFESWFYLTKEYPRIAVPSKTLILYDNKYSYLKDSAEKLSEKLKAKAASVRVKRMDELTAEDKKNYDIIFLRGSELTSTTSTNFNDVSSKVEWNKSDGDIEIAHKPGSASSPIFMIGGKNKAAVEKAVDEYVSRYNNPQ